MTHRYDVRNNPDKSWTVFDVFTGWPAELDSRTLTGLPIEEAYDILDQINQKDLLTRKAKGIA